MHDNNLNFRISLNELEEFTFDVAKILRNRSIFRKIPKGSTLYVGDIHGFYDNVLSAAKLTKKLSVDTLVFLGDYADRGPEQLRTIINVIYAFAHSEGLKKTYDFIDPEIKNLKCKVVALRGNHEDISFSMRYDLMHHLMDNFFKIWKTDLFNLKLDIQNFQQLNIHYQKFGTDIEYILNLIHVLYSFLPFMTKNSQGSVGIHGGIPQFSITDDFEIYYSKFQKIKTPINYMQTNYGVKNQKYSSKMRIFLNELVWNDAFFKNYQKKPKFFENFRGGVSKSFNKYALEVFLIKVAGKRLIRSHDASLGAYGAYWDNKLIHIYSAYPYGGYIKEKAFYFEDSKGKGKIINDIGRTYMNI